MICPTGKSARSCPAPVAKIYRFAFDPKHLYKPRRLAPSQRGVSWSSRNVGAGCDGRRRYRRRTIPMRTAKPCGPGARRWRQVCGECPQATVANKPDHRGERGISRKPLRRECPGASAEPVCSCAPFSFAYETAGAARTRHSLRPLVYGGASVGKNSGASCRGKANSHLTVVIPGREAKRREPGIHPTAIIAAQWIPGSRCARPGMTRERSVQSGACRNDDGEKPARTNSTIPHPPPFCGRRDAWRRCSRADVRRFAPARHRWRGRQGASFGVACLTRRSCAESACAGM